MINLVKQTTYCSQFTHCTPAKFKNSMMVTDFYYCYIRTFSVWSYFNGMFAESMSSCCIFRPCLGVTQHFTIHVSCLSSVSDTYQCFEAACLSQTSRYFFLWLYYYSTLLCLWLEQLALLVLISSVIFLALWNVVWFWQQLVCGKCSTRKASGYLSVVVESRMCGFLWCMSVTCEEECSAHDIFYQVMS